MSNAGRSGEREKWKGRGKNRKRRVGKGSEEGGKLRDKRREREEGQGSRSFRSSHSSCLDPPL